MKQMAHYSFRDGTWKTRGDVGSVILDDDGRRKLMVPVPTAGERGIEVDVLISRNVRTPLPEGARWEGSRNIEHNDIWYCANTDGSVCGFEADGHKYVPVPAWVLAAFREEGVL